jgi:hypothetical protein
MLFSIYSWTENEVDQKQSKKKKNQNEAKKKYALCEWDCYGTPLAQLSSRSLAA